MLAWSLPLAALLVAAPAPAMQGSADPEGFVPEHRPADMAKPQVDESVPARPLVAAAYGFIWVAVLVYVASVHLRTRRLESEVAALAQRLERRA
ncbi:MAG: CcmD family protein [Myxococcota bacterium]|nr:CcmD family protein [Myxococcota bacterium]